MHEQNSSHHKVNAETQAYIKHSTGNNSNANQITIQKKILTVTKTYWTTLIREWLYVYRPLKRDSSKVIVQLLVTWGGRQLATNFVSSVSHVQFTSHRVQ